MPHVHQSAYSLYPLAHDQSNESMFWINAWRNPCKIRDYVPELVKGCITNCFSRSTGRQIKDNLINKRGNCIRKWITLIATVNEIRHNKLFPNTTATQLKASDCGFLLIARPSLGNAYDLSIPLPRIFVRLPWAQEPDSVSRQSCRYSWTSRSSGLTTKEPLTWEVEMSESSVSSAPFSPLIAGPWGGPETTGRSSPPTAMFVDPQQAPWTLAWPCLSTLKFVSWASYCVFSYPHFGACDWLFNIVCLLVAC